MTPPAPPAGGTGTSSPAPHLVPGALLEDAARARRLRAARRWHRRAELAARRAARASAAVR